MSLNNFIKLIGSAVVVVAALTLIVGKIVDRRIGVVVVVEVVVIVVLHPALNKDDPTTPITHPSRIKDS